MHIERDDWYSIGTSLGVHVALIVLFAFLAAGNPPERQLGFIEVELGPYAEGRPVQEAEQESPMEAEPTPAEEPPEAEPQNPQPEPQPEPQQTVEEEAARAVDLAEQAEPVEDEEQVETPETETVAPEEQAEAAEEEQPDPEAEASSQEASGGGTEGGETGAASGDEGEGAEEEEAAPFNIEGLNRDRLSGPLPRYTEQVNAVIKVRITVDPQGRVVRRLPLMKGNPSLERAVMEALTNWRFNALPANAPQENQTGIVTFRFRLE